MTASLPTSDQPKWLFWLASFLLLVYPATALVVKDAHSSIFYLITLLGLFWALPKRWGLQPELDEKRIFFAGSQFFLLALLIYLLSSLLESDFNESGFKVLGKFAAFLLLIPFYMALVRLRINQGLLWYGLVIGTLVSLVVGSYQLSQATGPLMLRRAHGITHPILFGDLSLVMGMMALAGIGYFRRCHRWLVVLPILAALMGLSASFMAAARGGWLAIPFVLILLAWSARRSLKGWHIGVVLAVLVVLPTVAYLMPGSAVKPKVDSAIHNLSHYAESPIDSPVRSTSVGTRLEMWQASLTVVQDHLWLGVGWGNYREFVKPLVDAGLRNPAAIIWNNPHSQYISSLVNSGVLGLGSLLLLYLIPLALFLRSIGAGSADVRRLALAGAVLIIGFMGFAFSESVAERSLPTGFFSVYLALIFALITLQRSQEVTVLPARKQRLSVIMIVKDEADRLEGALQSVAGLADEIIVLDSGSSDGTLEIARRYTDQVFETDWPGYGPQKQRALDKATGDWVLPLDADERLTPELRYEIAQLLAAGSDCVAYRVPMATVIFGKRLDYGVTGRSPTRLFRREGARYKQALVHEGIQIEGKLGKLKHRFLHYTFRDFRHAVDKNNHYAWLWAQQRVDKRKWTGMSIATVRSLWIFISTYLLRLGFLDGRRGFIVAMLYSHYNFNKYAALWTLRLKPKSPAA